MTRHSWRWAARLSPFVLLLAWATLPVRGQAGRTMHADLRHGQRRVADLRRRSREHALLAARPDQRRQLQQARSGVAVQDRHARPAPRVQPAGDAADGRTACCTSPPARAARPSRSTRRPARCCGCTASTKARAAKRRRASSRAAASRTGPTASEERILYVTPGYQLVALNAKTGDPVAGFGKDGIVDLKLEIDQQMDLGHRRDRPARRAGRREGRRSSSAPRTCRAARRRSKTNEKGYVRGFDVRTGKRLWIFHTIPRPGEFGNDTWLNDSWSYTGNTGVWAQMSVDEELGIVYLPVELPTGDYYGGHRPGNNLFCGEPRRAST